MDVKKSVVKKGNTKVTKTPIQHPLEVRPQGMGEEIWDGNTAGWTLVTGRRRKYKK